MVQGANDGTCETRLVKARPQLTRAAAMVLVAFVVAVGMASAGTALAAPTTAVRAVVGTRAVVATRADAPTTTAPAAPGADISNTPQPVGRAVPVRSQRISDSLIWVWLLVVPLAVVAFVWWVARRSRRAVAPTSAPEG
jgi:hypothetical protein